jgi:MTH538 TIR-like domain (DUF1863)
VANEKHKVFISYHHANDQAYKQQLLELNRRYGLFLDGSVDIGEIDDNLDDNAIREIIRDQYLQDTTVTIVLVGRETKNRKHIDWEIYSSMYDGVANKKSGVLVINLPTTGCLDYYTAGHGDEEKRIVYPESTSWMFITARSEYEMSYPHLPDRIIDNLLKKGAGVSVTNWNRVMGDINKLRFLIEATFRDRATCDYDLSRPMRRSNS